MERPEFEESRTAATSAHPSSLCCDLIVPTEVTTIHTLGRGISRGTSMPGGKEPVTFWSESWDYPEPIVPPVLAARMKAEASVKSRQDSGSHETLQERWQLTLLSGSIKVLWESRNI